MNPDLRTQSRVEIRSDEKTVLTIEEKQKLIDEHREVVKILAAADLRSVENGEINGVRYETVFKSGKQQPVAIVELIFPEQHSFEVVLRPTGGNYEELYAQHESIRKHFPHIFFSSGEGHEANGITTVLALERIHGYEEKLNGEQFAEYIADPEHFEKFCKEIFEMVDEIYKEPLILDDINPTVGHNVIFNEEKERFQFFDIDTVKPSDWPFEKKFMEFVNRGQVMSDKEVQYMMRMIQLYLERYPEAQLAYESDEYTIGQYMLASDAPGPIDNTIEPDNPRYENCYRSIDWMGTQGRTDLPPITLWRRQGKDRHAIPSRLLDPIRQNDFEQTKEIVSQLGGRIIEKTFLEANK